MKPDPPGLLALGILERDGAWVLLGLATAGGAVALVWGVLYGLLRAVLFFVGHAML